MNINKKISKILQDEFVNYIGFADLRTYQEEVINFGGKIVQEYKYGISIGGFQQGNTDYQTLSDSDAIKEDIDNIKAVAPSVSERKQVKRI